jgi:hypothetical protein
VAGSAVASRAWVATSRSDGAIYCTDPIVSHGPYVNSLGSLSSRAFYVLKPAANSGGDRELVALGMLTLPNGIRRRGNTPRRPSRRHRVRDGDGDRCRCRHEQLTVATDVR